MTFTNLTISPALASIGAVMPDPAFEDACVVLWCAGVCVPALAVALALAVPVVPAGAPPVPVPAVAAPVPVPVAVIAPAAERCEPVLLLLP
jgi:hypothetical protein